MIERKLVVDRIAIYCVPCTQTYFISRKGNDGQLVEAQVCPHTIFKDISFKKTKVVKNVNE